MRITKKLLREAKMAMLRRVGQLSRLEDPAWLRAEYARCFPAALQLNPSISEVDVRETLYKDMIERALPDHWCE